MTEPKILKYVCEECGCVSEVKTVWSLKRKTYPNLCKRCANLHKRVDVSIKTKKDWTDVYNDPSLTANTLKEAKSKGLKYYKRVCDIHGPVPYATLDNTCRLCTREQAKRRNAENKDFNRPRIILNSIKRRSKIKNLDFDISIDDLRGKIPKKCSVLGIEMSYDGNKDSSPSVDRFNSTSGYTKDNIEIISDRANRIKNDGTVEEHLLISIWMLRKEGHSLEDVIKKVTDLFKRQSSF